MAYFPCFLDLTGKPCLIVGGGKVALRKAEKLLAFSPKLTVIAKQFCPEFQQFTQVTRLERAFQFTDLEGMQLVISATEDRALNHEIFRYCQERGILVNTVDEKENCGFLFPALAQQGAVTVGISTSGTSPIFARYLREEIEKLLAEKAEIGAVMQSCRPKILARIGTEKARKNAAETILARCLSAATMPDAEEIDRILEEFSH